ncbi:MAG: ester cyclase [Vicinamibacterales bacterium]
MSEQNKAVVRRFYGEVFNKQDANAIDELCDPNFVDHGAMPGQAPGRQGMKDSFTMFLKAFPDMHVNVEELIAERDLVAARFTGEATHRGELFGTAPTGKKMKFNGIDIIRIKDGKAIEAWHQGDDVIGLMQLGIKPPMPPA